MQGVISVAANAFPKEFSEMVCCSLNFDFKKAKSINKYNINLKINLTKTYYYQEYKNYIIYYCEMLIKENNLLYI